VVSRSIGQQKVEYVMKHLKHISNMPAKATVEGHPDLKDSINAFIADPVGTIELHLKKVTPV